MPKKKSRKKDTTLYCSCKTLYDHRRAMLQCHYCDEWYHFDCEKLTPKKLFVARELGKYCCIKCRDEELPEDVLKEMEIEEEKVNCSSEETLSCPFCHEENPANVPSCAHCEKEIICFCGSKHSSKTHSDDLIKCTTCFKWYHCSCVTDEVSQHEEYDSFTCKYCQVIFEDAETELTQGCLDDEDEKAKEKPKPQQKKKRRGKARSKTPTQQAAKPGTKPPPKLPKKPSRPRRAPSQLKTDMNGLTPPDSLSSQQTSASGSAASGDCAYCAEAISSLAKAQCKTCRLYFHQDCLPHLKNELDESVCGQILCVRHAAQGNEPPTIPGPFLEYHVRRLVSKYHADRDPKEKKITPKVIRRDCENVLGFKMSNESRARVKQIAREHAMSLSGKKRRREEKQDTENTEMPPAKKRRLNGSVASDDNEKKLQHLPQQVDSEMKDRAMAPKEVPPTQALVPVQEKEQKNGADMDVDITEENRGKKRSSRETSPAEETASRKRARIAAKRTKPAQPADVLDRKETSEDDNRPELRTPSPQRLAEGLREMAKDGKFGDLLQGEWVKKFDLEKRLNMEVRMPKSEEAQDAYLRWCNVDKNVRLVLRRSSDESDPALKEFFREIEELQKRVTDILSRVNIVNMSQGEEII